MEMEAVSGVEKRSSKKLRFLRGKFYNGTVHAAKLSPPMPGCELLTEKITRFMKRRREDEILGLKIKFFNSCVISAQVDGQLIKLSVRASLKFHGQAVFDDVSFEEEAADGPRRAGPPQIGRLVCLVQLPSKEEAALVRMYKGEQMWEQATEYHQALCRRFRLLKLTGQFKLVLVKKFVGRVYLWPVIPTMFDEELFWHIDLYDNGLAARATEAITKLKK